MSKPFKEQTAVEKYAPVVGVAIIAIIFTLMGFFVKQDCDIDRVFLWCRLHPFSVADLIGCIMFYAGCFVLAGGLKLIGVELWNPENSSKWNLITFAGLVLSIVLIWNL